MVDAMMMGKTQNNYEKLQKTENMNYYGESKEIRRSANPKSRIRSNRSCEKTSASINNFNMNMKEIYNDTPFEASDFAYEPANSQSSKKRYSAEKKRHYIE